MAEVVTMPRLSDTMTVGTVAKWHAAVGDQINEGDLLAEIETDKATMEFESFQEGVLLHIGVAEGEEAPVDSILAILGEKGEDISALLSGGAPSAPAPAPEEAKEEKAADASASPSAPAPAPTPAPVATMAPASPAPAVSADGRIKASPLAKKIASERGISLGEVSGSGEGGRIVKRDVEQWQPSTRPAAPAPSQFIAGQESFEDAPVTNMRKTIARRLAESKFEAPHFYLTVEVDMARAMEARKAINAAGDVKISFNDFVVKACAMALTKHPYVNASWRGDVIRFNHHVHIGVAVAVEEGLLVPVVRHADQKGMATISGEVREYAQKAKDKKLQPQDWEGNTFTISNLGMFGIEEFTAIINPPDSCILAVGAIVEKPVVKNGQIVVGHKMKVTLSCDHRVVDGAKGAAFLQTLQSYLENPVSMLV